MRRFNLTGALAAGQRQERTSFPATFMGRKLCGYVYRNPDGTLEDGNEDVAAGVFDVHEFSVKQYSLRRLTKRR